VSGVNLEGEVIYEHDDLYWFRSPKHNTIRPMWEYGDFIEFCELKCGARSGETTSYGSCVRLVSSLLRVTWTAFYSRPNGVP
jgi:hypothetical protein